MPADVPSVPIQDGNGSHSPRPVILVVEDEALTGLLIEDTLQSAGYDTILANSGQSALALAKAAGQLSALVADIHLMHGGDGRSIVREIRKSNPLLPTVVVTGFAKAAPEADLRGLGGPTVRLVKPFSCEELLESLAGVLSSTNSRAPRSVEKECAASREKMHGDS
ncbi:response regulator [Belnapia sp. T18]|uniref:Response regulator n=1 Tax=Belnapia arida TaxID=2804533 RepID=A0ABS1UAF5_9PROT|nr:response regulator [Belnapia arida]MBL6081668.1 response regulator [Belnapia arida]